MIGAGIIMIGAGVLMFFTGFIWLLVLLLTGKKKKQKMEWNMKERY